MSRVLEVTLVIMATKEDQVIKVGEPKSFIFTHSYSTVSLFPSLHLLFIPLFSIIFFPGSPGPKGLPGIAMPPQPQREPERGDLGSSGGRGFPGAPGEPGQPGYFGTKGKQ